MAFIPDAAPKRFVPDDPNAVIAGRPKVKAADASADTTPGVSDIVKGAGDAALSGASKVATGVVGSGLGLINRLVAAATGGDGQLASDTTKDYVNQRFGHDTTTPVGKEIGQAASDTLGAFGGNLLHAAGGAVQAGADKLGIDPAFTHSQLDEAGDLFNVIPAMGGLARGAAAATDAAKLAAANSASAATRAIPVTDIQSALDAVGFPQIPSKNPNSTALQRAGAGVVGEGSLPAGNTLTSQAINNRLAKHDAGVPAASELNYATLKNARDAGPGQVFEAARNALPAQLTQDSQLATALNSVGDGASQLPRSPDVEAVKQTMMNQPAMSRDELFANMSEARDRAASLRAGSHPDKDALADAYNGISNAYEDFLGRQLRDNPNPSNPVSLADFQDARTRYAKNYDVQNALQGTDVNASKIGASQRKNPDLLTGGLQLIAEQYNRHRLSTGLGQTTLTDTGMGSSGSVSGQTARTAGRYIGGGMGAGAGYLLHGGAGAGAGAGLGAGAGDLAMTGLQNVIRRALTGTPASGEASASAAINDPRLADFFNPQAPEAPRAPLELQPPPGQAFTPHQPALATGGPTQRDFFGFGARGMSAEAPTAPPAAAAVAPGGISLADLLSHGVEQHPAEGLSFGPMGYTPGEGIPFNVDAGHASGGLQLSDLLTHADPQDLRDLAHVVSQGVPEDILQRAAGRFKPNARDQVGQSANRRPSTLAALLDPGGG